MANDSPDVFSPDHVPPPGDTILELLEEQEMTQTEVARRLGVSLKHLHQVVKGRASVSAELALGLERVFSVSAEFWLTREANYRAHEARISEAPDLEKAVAWAERFPLRELERRGFIPRGAKGEVLVASVLKFLGIAGPRQWESPAVAYRKSEKFQSDEYALSAWLRLGETKAREIACEPFDADRFRASLQEARNLTREVPEQWEDALVELCAGAGVAVVIVEHFKEAKVNGATRWLTPSKALIQLSIRYRWEDVFWFTFFHEAGHVLLHQKKELFVEPEKLPAAESVEPRLLGLEEEANRFAGQVLIPPEFESRLPNLSVAQVPAFAEMLGISPAVVVGRLQHEKYLPYNQGNRLRRRLKFAED